MLSRSFCLCVFAKSARFKPKNCGGFGLALTSASGVLLPTNETNWSYRLTWDDGKNAQLWPVD